MTKSSSKLGITIPQLSQNSDPDRIVIRLTIENQSGQASFVALAAPWITIPTRICTKLNIAYDQTLSILELKPIQPHSRPSDDISAMYGIGRRASNLWIHTMHRKGLVEVLHCPRVDERKNYVVTGNGKRIARLIEAIERDYNKMAAERGVDDAETILRQTKVRRAPSPTMESGVKGAIQQYSASIALN